MIEKFAEKNKLPNFRIKQFNKQYYQEAISSFDELTTWPVELREKLNKETKFSSLSQAKELISKDGNTIKAALKTKDGKYLESVLMKFKDGRNSICVSCMIGCPVGCKFCATGKMGFTRNLTAEEIVDQIMHFKRLLKKQREPISNIVFMGMGEPLLNLKEVSKAIGIISDPDKLALSEKRITVSTSGYAPQLKKLVDEGFKGQIAISLHAPEQKLREKLIPVAKKYNLGQLFEVLDYITDKTNKKITYEYILIKGINDRKEHAKMLVSLLKNRLAHVNLIPYNITPGVDFEKPSKKRINEFAETLRQGGLNCTIRVAMGDDIKAACGQLIKKTT